MTGRPRRFGVADMRYRCNVESITEVIDSAGQPISSWSVLLRDEPCQFLPVGGSESLRGRQLEEKAKAVFRMRYRPGVDQSMRIVFEGTTYGIIRVDMVDGLRRYMEVTTTT